MLFITFPKEPCPRTFSSSKCEGSTLSPSLPMQSLPISISLSISSSFWPKKKQLDEQMNTFKIHATWCQRSIIVWCCFGESQLFSDLTWMNQSINLFYFPVDKKIISSHSDWCFGKWPGLCTIFFKTSTWYLFFCFLTQLFFGILKFFFSIFMPTLCSWD